MEDFLRSNDFNSRLVAYYKDEMRDMKAGFSLYNLSVVGADWLFVLEESGETTCEEGA